MNLRKLALITLVTVTLAGANLLAQSLSEIQGKWTSKKNTERNGDVVQFLTVKDGTFSYKMQSKTGETLLRAKGTVKVEKLGPFNVLKLSDIEGAYGEDTLQATNDDRAIIYMKGWNTLTLALNFDSVREGEKTESDTYTQVKE